MKHLTSFFIILIIVSGAYAQTKYTIKTSDMNIKGTSTFHDWELKATTINAMCELNCEGNVIKGIRSFYLEIPTTSLKSENGSKMMDDKVYNALKSETAKTITFKLEKIVSVDPDDNGWDVRCVGSLSIAGVATNSVIMVHLTTESDGSITFSGMKKLKMTDYNVDPPKAMLGTLTTGNEIEIEFKLNLTKV